MPRPAKPWYRKARRMWFGLVAGKQVPLGISDPDKREIADAVLAQLRAEVANCPPIVRSLPANSPPIVQTVSESVAAFLARKRSRVEPGTWVGYDIALRVHFLPVFGSRPVASLTGEEIEDWADRREWSSSTRHDYLGVVQCWLKWSKHPLTIHRPPKESRGAEAVLSDEQFAVILDHAGPGDFPELLRVLRETGARPQEIARLTVESVDWANACHRTKIHKSRRHGGERVIHFNTAAVAILAAQRKRHPTGLLFRSARGTAFKKDGIVHRMDRVSKRSGVKATAYGLGRHSFCTRALVAGVPDAVVAELMGHRGTGMVAKHYGHVGGQSRVLKDAVEMVGKPKAG